MGALYDPNGEAAVWEAAARLVADMRLAAPMPDDVEHDYWNTALTQAARALETEARKIKQANGMYYRVLDGSSGT
jgi:hypothetical protein